MAGKPGRSGGARPGAGRPPTPPTPAPEHDDPLDFLRSVWKGEREASPAQVRAASAALPYVHKKLGEGVKKDEKAKAAETATAAGKYAPRQGPKVVSIR